MDDTAAPKVGRPREYHTEEERQAAIRASAKKSYQKRVEKEQKSGPADAPKDLPQYSSTVQSKDFQPRDPHDLPNAESYQPTYGAHQSWSGPPTAMNVDHHSIPPNLHRYSISGYPGTFRYNSDPNGVVPPHLPRGPQHLPTRPRLPTEPYANHHKSRGMEPEPIRSLTTHNTNRLAAPGFYTPTTHLGTQPHPIVLDGTNDEFTNTNRANPHAITPNLEERRAGTTRSAQSLHQNVQSRKVQKRAEFSLDEINALAAKVKRNPENYQELLEQLRARQASSGKYREILPINQERDREHQDLLNDISAHPNKNRGASTSEKKHPEEAYARIVKERCRPDSDAERAKKRVKTEADVRRAEAHATTMRADKAAYNAPKAEEAQKAEERAPKEARRAEQEYTGQDEAALEQSQASGFDRHVNFIAGWLQAPSWPETHTFPTDGQSIYVRKIKPRILQIRESGANKNADFAVRYVALMALTHVLLLIYVHMDSKVGREILQFYEAEAQSFGDDVLTQAMHATLQKVKFADIRWLKKGEGAAGVLLREVLEVWVIMRPVADRGVLQDLRQMLWVYFGCKEIQDDIWDEAHRKELGR